LKQLSPQTAGFLRASIRISIRSKMATSKVSKEFGAGSATKLNGRLWPKAALQNPLISVI
jgi:hypothetical protein